RCATARSWPGGCPRTVLRHPPRPLRSLLRTNLDNPGRPCQTPALGRFRPRTVPHPLANRSKDEMLRRTPLAVLTGTLPLLFACGGSEQTQAPPPSTPAGAAPPAGGPPGASSG